MFRGVQRTPGWHRDRVPNAAPRADRAIDANSARASSSLIFGDLIKDRLPRLLLLVNEGGGLGGRHRIGVAPQRRKLLLQFRVESDFAQVFADLVDDRLGRANRRHQNSPASGLEIWNRFRHCGNIGEFRQTLGGCDRDQLDRTRSRGSRDARIAAVTDEQGMKKRVLRPSLRGDQLIDKGAVIPGE
jgi:hypothetical protein